VADWVQAQALAVDPGWRRLSYEQRCDDAADFRRAVGSEREARTSWYSMLRPDAQILVWRLAGSPEALEEASARALNTSLGRWLVPRHSFWGRLGDSPYVRREHPEVPPLFSGERRRHLVVYPFSKTGEWYLLDADQRRRLMADHIRVGRSHPAVRQLLAYCFGIDDQEFLVAYETDDLADFSELVRELRATEARRFTAMDTPVLTGTHRPIEELLHLLGAPLEVRRIPVSRGAVALGALSVPEPPADDEAHQRHEAVVDRPEQHGDGRASRRGDAHAGEHGDDDHLHRAHPTG
jgi:chlorite dismutase